MGGWRLNLFGGFDLRSPVGLPIRLNGRKTMALLAYLALCAGRTQARDKLASLLWGDSPDDLARGSLRQALAHLRRHLCQEKSLLTADGDSIRLVEGALSLDVTEFEQAVADGSPAALERAIALYHGDLLDGFPVRAPPFEEWLLVERQRLRSLAQDALSRRLDQAIAAGDDEAGVRTALRLLAIDPLQETGHRALMLMYARQGRQAEALKQFQTCRAILERELGVQPEPETERLFRDIRERRRRGTLPARTPPPPPPSAAPPLPSPPAAPDPTPPAERRQLTVLCGSLVGVADTPATLDPEDLHDLVRRAKRLCVDAIQRFDGHVAAQAGDLILAWFGYPQAHEDDAERAVRAGLDLTGAMSRLAVPTAPSMPLSLQARVGIATGLVITGDPEAGTVGETPALATRLQEHAAPGTVLVADVTHRLLGGLFDAVEATGDPLHGWRIIGECRTASRFLALRPTTSTPLVGREQECALLVGRWELAKADEGQMVVLSGEPGIGKSRLVEALAERVGAEGQVMRCQCSPFGRHSALQPFIDEMERSAAFRRDDTPDAKRTKIAALLAEREATADLPLVAALLSLPDDGGTTDDHAPPRSKPALINAILRQIHNLAARRPLLLVLEDAHWIDPTSRDLMDRLAEHVPEWPVLVVMTTRPDASPSWAGHTHVLTLPLTRLKPEPAAAIITRVTGGKALPDDVMEQILSRSDGVPLYVEELCQTVLESGLLHDDGDRYTLARPLPPLAVPMSLRDSLMARLDHLGPAKEAAQVAAVIGREFTGDLVAAIADWDAATLNNRLLRLVEAGLVFRRGGAYTFKHALVQEAAYQTMLRERRRALHRRAAAALRERSPDLAASRPEVIAEHLTRAGDTRDAIEWWRRAGEHAGRRSANAEAVRHFRKGLELVAALPEGRDHDEQELRLLIGFGPTLMAMDGWHTREVGRVYARARDLSRAVGMTGELFATVWGWWLFCLSRGDHRAALPLVDELFDLARQENRDDFRLQACHAAWATGFEVGDLQGALAKVGEGLSLYRPEEHRHHALLYGGHDPAVCGLCHAATIEWMLGHPDRAMARCDEALALARDLGHAASLAHALGFQVQILHLRRDFPGAVAATEKLLALAGEQRLGLYGGMAANYRGWSRLADDPQEVLGELRVGLRRLSESRDYIILQHYARMAEVCGDAGQHREGVRLLDEALAHAAESGRHYFEPELHRLRGELLAASQAPAAAEACFRQALRIAGEQGALSLTLRAAVGLARLYQGQGKSAEARTLLSPVLAAFTEGFDTPDLTEARTVLDALTSLST